MKLKHLYIALGLSALLTACKDDEPVVNPTRDLVEIPVSFTIKLSSGDATRDASIGTWEEGEDPSNDRGGTTFENTINSLTPVLYLADYRGVIDEAHPVAVLEGNQTLAASSVIPSQDANGDPISGQFDVSGTMICSGLTTAQLLEYESRLRLALFINCAEGDVMSPLNIYNPEHATFNHHGKPDDHKDSGSERFQGIPMYGVTDLKFFKEIDDQNKEVYKVYAANSTEAQKKRLTIPILRSMAKVNVTLNTDISGKIDDKKVRLVRLAISRHAVKGYVVPKSWDRVTSVTSLNVNGAGCNPLTGGSYLLDSYYNHGCYVEPQTDYSDLSDEHKDDDEYKDNDENHLRFYLPDTYNCSNDGDNTSPEIYMELTYTIDGVYEADGTTLKEFKHPLFFREKDQWPRALEGYEEYKDVAQTKPNLPMECGVETAPWDIIRNHIYEFVIEGVEATTGALTVNVSVKQWEKHHYELTY